MLDGHSLPISEEQCFDSSDRADSLGVGSSPQHQSESSELGHAHSAKKKQKAG